MWGQKEVLLRIVLGEINNELIWAKFAYYFGEIKILKNQKMLMLKLI